MIKATRRNAEWDEKVKRAFPRPGGQGDVAERVTGDV